MIWYQGQKVMRFMLAWKSMTYCPQHHDRYKKEAAEMHGIFCRFFLDDSYKDRRAAYGDGGTKSNIEKMEKNEKSCWQTKRTMVL